MTETRDDARLREVSLTVRLQSDSPPYAGCDRIIRAGKQKQYSSYEAYSTDSEGQRQAFFATDCPVVAGRFLYNLGVVMQDALRMEMQNLDLMARTAMLRVANGAVLVALIAGLSLAAAQAPAATANQQAPATTENLQPPSAAVNPQEPSTTARPARPTPPTRDPHTPGYVAAKELPDGAVPPANADGNFIIGPTHNPAPEMTVHEGVPQGTVYEFTMSSADSKIYPGIARDANTIWHGPIPPIRRRWW